MSHLWSMYFYCLLKIQCFENWLFLYGSVIPLSSCVTWLHKWDQKHSWKFGQHFIRLYQPASRSDGSRDFSTFYCSLLSHAELNCSYPPFKTLSLLPVCICPCAIACLWESGDILWSSFSPSTFTWILGLDSSHKACTCKHISLRTQPASLTNLLSWFFC